MGHSTPLELTKIKELAADIQKIPAKIDSTEQAKSARKLLKKYAELSGKIERNVMIGAEHQKDLAKIRTKEFRTTRQALKEKIHAMLNANSIGEKPAKKPVKSSAPSAKPKAAAKSVAKATPAKSTAKKSEPKAPKTSKPKKSSDE